MAVGGTETRSIEAQGQGREWQCYGHWNIDWTGGSGGREGRAKGGGTGGGTYTGGGACTGGTCTGGACTDVLTLAVGTYACGTYTGGGMYL